MAVIRWEQPPPDPRELMALKWQEAAGPLRMRPHRWGVLMEGGALQCVELEHYIKAGHAPFGPKGYFEAYTAELSRDRGVMYARYVGGAA